MPLQAKYINSSNVLVEAAVAAGFDADEARAVIADPEAYRSEVRLFDFSRHASEMRAALIGCPGHI